MLKKNDIINFRKGLIAHCFSKVKALPVINGPKQLKINLEKIESKRKSKQKE